MKTKNIKKPSIKTPLLLGRLGAESALRIGQMGVNRCTLIGAGSVENPIMIDPE